MYCFLIIIGIFQVLLMLPKKNKKGALSIFERWNNVKECKLCPFIPTSCGNEM